MKSSTKITPKFFRIGSEDHRKNWPKKYQIWNIKPASAGITYRKLGSRQTCNNRLVLLSVNIITRWRLDASYIHVASCQPTEHLTDAVTSRWRLLLLLLQLREMRLDSATDAATTLTPHHRLQRYATGTLRCTDGDTSGSILVLCGVRRREKRCDKSSKLVEWVNKKHLKNVGPIRNIYISRLCYDVSVRLSVRLFICLWRKCIGAL